MPLLLLDDSEETNRQAAGLMTKFRGDHEQIPFYENNLPLYLAASYETFILLGHSSSRFQLGNFPTRQFSKKFNEEFEINFGKEQKTLVKHIYICVSDAGFVDKNDYSLAQTIADALFEKGFVNIVVHAIKKDFDPQHPKCRITISSDARTKGYVSAEVLTEEADEELVKLGETISKADGSLIKNQREKGSIRILETGDIEEELEKKENTFTPKLSSFFYIPPRIVTLLKGLQVILTELKQDKEREDIISKLISNIKSDMRYENIISLLHDACKKYENIGNFSKSAIVTFKALVNLKEEFYDPNFLAPQIIEQPKPINTLKEALNMHGEKQSKQEQNQALKQQQDALLKARRAESKLIRETLDAREQIQKEEAIRQAAENKTKVIKILTDYAAVLSAQAKSWFCGFVMPWNRIKLDKALLLRNAAMEIKGLPPSNNNLGQANYKRIINRLMINDPIVIKGASSKTKKLLNDILADNLTPYIKEDKKVPKVA